MTDAWDDRPIDATWDLAVFLGGSHDSFTGKLLELIAKAQATPENMGRLELAFPREVAAWKTWQSMSPAPTFGQLREALAALEPRTDRLERIVLTELGSQRETQQCGACGGPIEGIAVLRESGSYHVACGQASALG
jgi:hypothetical protein